MTLLRFSSVLAATSTASAVFFLVAGARAQTFTSPGTNNQPLPTVGTAFGGTQLGSTEVASFGDTNGGQTITGRLYSAVFRGGTTQTINGVTFGGSDQLDFYYQLFLDRGSTATVDSLSINNFTNFALATAQITADADGPTSNPLNAGGSAFSTVSRGGTGTGLLFSFSTPLAISGYSQTIIVRTTAESFSNMGGASVQSLGGVSANLAGTLFAPLASSAAAPEPGSVSLMGMGIAGSGIGALRMVRRRRRLPREATA